MPNSWESWPRNPMFLTHVRVELSSLEPGFVLSRVGLCALRGMEKIRGIDISVSIGDEYQMTITAQPSASHFLRFDMDKRFMGEGRCLRTTNEWYSAWMIRCPKGKYIEAYDPARHVRKSSGAQRPSPDRDLVSRGFACCFSGSRPFDSCNPDLSGHGCSALGLDVRNSRLEGYRRLFLQPSLHLPIGRGRRIRDRCYGLMTSDYRTVHMISLSH